MIYIWYFFSPFIKVPDALTWTIFLPWTSKIWSMMSHHGNGSCLTREPSTSTSHRRRWAGGTPEVSRWCAGPLPAVGGGWWTSSPPVVGRWCASGGPAVTSLTSVPQPDVVDIENFWRLRRRSRNHLLQVSPSPPIPGDFWPEWWSPPNHRRWPPAVRRRTSSSQPTHHLDNLLIFGLISANFIGGTPAHLRITLCVTKA